VRSIIALLLVAVFLSGCGTISRWKESRKTKEETQTSSLTTTKTVEKIDTVLKLKKDSVVAVRPIDDLFKGKPIEARDGNSSVRVTYDGSTGNIRAVGISEAREIPVSMERITESSNKVDQVATTKDIVRAETKEYKNSGFAWGVVLTLVVVLLVVILLVYRRARYGLIR